jgi:hypothetical protein
MPPRKPQLTDPALISMDGIDTVIGDAVRRVAATDPDPGNPFRGLYMTDESAVETARALRGGGLDARMQRAVATLGLDPLDGALLCLCAAPVLDGRYGRLIGFLHDDLTRRLPSPRLLALLLAGVAAEQQVLERLACDAPLRHGGAIEMLEEAAGVPAVDRQLALDEQLAAFLLGAQLGADEMLREVAEVRPQAIPVRDPETIERVSQTILTAEGVPVLVAGPDAEQIAAQALGRALLMLAASRLDDARLISKARLRASLTGARLALHGLDRLSIEERSSLHARLGELGQTVLMCASAPRPPLALAGLSHLTVIVPAPDQTEQARLWAAHAPQADSSDVVAAFRLSAEQIADAARLAAAEAGSAGRTRPEQEDLLRAARRISRSRLEEHATLLQGACRWQDLVLADGEIAQLRAISARLRHRALVLQRWGFGRLDSTRAGLKILFAGEPGTGKTMACQVIANDLGLDLFRVDLSQTVSKFIGETEKNLARLFDAAQDAGAVLFFDEADALFGKRSAVGNAHDRYANLEVAYLLQRIEEFTGAVVLATNLRHNLDQAFLRRLDFLVDFPLPDHGQRRRLWESHLPPQAPLASDVDLDALSAHSLPGGSIRNCVLAAAFAAADDGGGAICSSHLQHAVRLEQRKLGRLSISSAG